MKTPGVESAIVLGGAPTVFDELEEARAMAGGDADLIAVNWAGVAYPGEFQWWVSLHPDLVDGFRRRRESEGHPPGAYTFASKSPAPGVDHVVEHGYMKPREPSGSSGLFGTLLGCDHYRRVYVCGVTLATTREPQHIAHTVDPNVKVEPNYRQYINGWEHVINCDRNGIRQKTTVVRDGKLRELFNAEEHPPR